MAKGAGVKLEWAGKQVREAIVPGLLAKLDGAASEGALVARQELYPGHGYKTGELQKSVVPIPATYDGNRIVAGFRTRRIYALFVEARYGYLKKGRAAMIAALARRK